MPTKRIARTLRICRVAVRAAQPHGLVTEDTTDAPASARAFRSLRWDNDRNPRARAREQKIRERARPRRAGSLTRAALRNHPLKLILAACPFVAAAAARRARFAICEFSAPDRISRRLVRALLAGGSNGAARSVRAQRVYIGCWDSAPIPLLRLPTVLSLDPRARACIRCGADFRFAERKAQNRVSQGASDRKESGENPREREKERRKRERAREGEGSATRET